jgi:hypothetical protein
MRFARLFPVTLLLKDVIQLTQQQYAALQVSNPTKAALLRPLVTDILPTITALQKIVAGPIVVEATQARETWLVVNKTASELEIEELETEQSQIADRITKINDAIAEHQAVLDVPYSEPAPAATNGLEITALRDRMRVAERAIRSVERDLIVTMRSTKWTLRKLRTNTVVAAATSKTTKS